MDLSFIQAMIPNLAAFFHLTPATLLFLIGVIVTTANIIGKLIPDNVTGFMYYVRALCNLIGLYVANRVAPGVTVNDVAKQVLGQQTPGDASAKIQELAQDAEALIPSVLDAGLADPAEPAAPVPISFPGLSRGPDGKFISQNPST